MANLHNKESKEKKSVCISPPLTKFELIGLDKRTLQHSIRLLCEDTTFTNYWGPAEVTLANRHKSSGYGRLRYRLGLLRDSGHGAGCLCLLFGLLRRLQLSQSLALLHIHGRVHRRRHSLQAVARSLFLGGRLLGDGDSDVFEHVLFQVFNFSG